MSVTFEFATANRIVFGDGSLQKMIPEIAAMGKRAFILTGRDQKRAEPLVLSLHKHNVQTEIFFISGEPTTDLVMEGAEAARKSNVDLVISMGGGSVIDAGKAIAALVTNPGHVMDYLEVIGNGKQLTIHPVLYIAIPTTAGTGSEVTRNAVVKSIEHDVKVSMRSARMIPDIAIVDPMLTYSMSPEVTASTGMDALTQLIEPFVSNKANPMTDSLCREGIQRVARSLKVSFTDGEDSEARADMALVSLFGGLALANAKLGAVHGIAGPMGGMFPVPHGVACARLLPPVMEANVHAIEKRGLGCPYLERFREVGRLLTGNPNANASDGVQWIHDLAEFLHLPHLSDFGLRQDAFRDLIQKSQQASSMKGNPISLTDEELEKILMDVL